MHPEVAAMTMTTLVHRINLFVHTNRAYGRSAKDAVDTLSVFLQLMLFPDTPPSVLTSLRLHASTDPAADVDAVEVPPQPNAEGLSISERTAALSKRAVNTVNALADAGAAQFRARGYRSTSVDDIVETANVARGTFYKYFSDKQDLLAAVAAEIYEAGMAFAVGIVDVDPMAKKSTLRQWLATYVEFYDRYSGCIEAWAEGATDDPTIVAIGENGQVQIDIGAARMLIRGPDRYPFDPVMSALILRALVTRLPQAALDLPEPIDDDELVDLLMTCISRGFFGRMK
jgi:AcrR family transcriptional regulator